MKKILLLCVMIALLAAVLPPAPMCYSSVPYGGPQGGESDLSHHRGNLSPQEWSIQRTTVNAAQPKSTSPWARLSVQIDPVLSEPDTDSADASIGIKSMASGHIYLHNLSLRF